MSEREAKHLLFPLFRIPAKYAKGTDKTIAHGQDVTKNINALLIHSFKSPTIIGGINAKINAKITTIGVYIFANLVINISVFDLFLFEFFTNSII